MISLLTSLVSHFVCWVETAVVEVVNGFIGALAAVVGTVLALLPTMPSSPTIPSQITTAASWVAWVFPVGTAVDLFAFALAAWLIWLVVATILRWVKVVE